MPGPRTTLALALLLTVMQALPAAAAATPSGPPASQGLAPVLPLQLAQYYAPPPPPPGYRHPRRRCWTETRRVVRYDRWGQPHVRWVPRRVCAYR